ncbi:MAG: MFS transporter [Planctomycetaceae bacterium]
MKTDEDSWWPWAVCFVLLLATMLNYMDRQALAVTFPLLKRDFNLSEDRVGMVEGCFGYAFAFGSLLFGFLADRFGPRYLYPIVLAGWSLAGIATSMAGQEWVLRLLESPGDEPGTAVYRWLLICRIVLGVCEAGHWPCALLTVRAILGERRRTLGNGILQSGASIGAVTVPLYIEAAERAGQPWEFPFWSIGVAGLLWIPVWFALVKGRSLSGTRTDRVTDNSAGIEVTLTPDHARHADFAKRIVVMLLIVGTLTISWQFLRAWLGLFLEDHHGYSKQATRGLMSLYFISADVGCILSGILVAWLARRGMTVQASRVAGFLAFALLTSCGALVPYAGNGWLMIALLLIAGAGILGLHPFYYSLTQELSARHMGSLSGLLAAAGWIVSSTWQMYLGKYIQEHKSYELGLLMVGLAPMIGLVALWLLWPRERPALAVA